VPLEQSERFQNVAHAYGGTVDVRVHRGGKHGWMTMLWDIAKFADWFDQHLRDGKR
jgi:S-formylglutathione hydrolase FrmB